MLIVFLLNDTLILRDFYWYVIDFFKYSVTIRNWLQGTCQPGLVKKYKYSNKVAHLKRFTSNLRLQIQQFTGLQYPPWPKNQNIVCILHQFTQTKNSIQHPIFVFTFLRLFMLCSHGAENLFMNISVLLIKLFHQKRTPCCISCFRLLGCYIRRGGPDGKLLD